MCKDGADARLGIHADFDGVIDAVNSGNWGISREGLQLVGMRAAGCEIDLKEDC
jgi:hypothetical protein